MELYILCNFDLQMYKKKVWTVDMGRMYFKKLLNLMLLENGKRFSLGLELKVAAISSKTLTSREVHPRVNFPISGISLYF